MKKRRLTVTSNGPALCEEEAICALECRDLAEGELGLVLGLAAVLAGLGEDVLNLDASVLGGREGLKVK